MKKQKKGSKNKKYNKKYNNKTRKNGGYIGKTIRQSFSLNFLITRIFNPANTDRMLYKNAYFLQFINENDVKKIYNKDEIDIVEQCGTYYIYKKSYTKGSMQNDTDPIITNSNVDNIAENYKEKINKTLENDTEKENKIISFIENKPRKCFSIIDTFNRKSFSKLNNFTS
jgi:hypothetical protein